MLEFHLEEDLAEPAKSTSMGTESARGRVALGFRVKTGKAIVVALGVRDRVPSLILRTEISLTDSTTPETSQPHHEVMHLPWPEALRAVAPAERKIRSAATNSLSKLLAQLSAQGSDVHAAGITGGTTNDPGRIANPHIRAHAAEGRLFREAAAFAARECKLSAETLPEVDIRAIAVRRLARKRSEIDERLGSLGGSIKPWRADEKLAALAAWIALSRRAGARKARASRAKR